MQPSNSYFKIWLVIIVWLICIIVIYGGYDHENLFNYFANRVFIGIASLITLIVFFRDSKRYKAEQDLRAFAATITAGVCVGVLLLMTWMLKQRDNSPTILFASAGKIFSESIDLRENKTFKITTAEFLSKKYIRGRYALKDSLLILDSAAVATVLAAHRFIVRSLPSNDSIIRPEEPGLLEFLTRSKIPDTSTGIYLIPIDANGTVIENARQFRVY